MEEKHLLALFGIIGTIGNLAHSGLVLDVVGDTMFVYPEEDYYALGVTGLSAEEAKNMLREQYSAFSFAVGGLFV